MNWAVNAPDRHIPHMLSVLGGVALACAAIIGAGWGGVVPAAGAGVAGA